MTRGIALFFVALLLLFFTPPYAARPQPNFPKDSPPATQHNKSTVDVEAAEYYSEDSCEGVVKEECLIRRTLAAHLDYVYTQKEKP